MIIRVPAEDVSTCRDGLAVERMYDYVVACKGLRKKRRKVAVIEDDARPHTPVRFEGRCQREAQEVRILRIQKSLQGVSRGKYLPAVTACKVARILMSKEISKK